MKNKLAVTAALSAMACLLLASEQVISCCRSGLRLCAELIIPSLFPFFVLSGLLSALGFPAMIGRLLAPAAARLFRVSGAGCSALIAGLCGGYPMGAAYIERLYKGGYISAREAGRLLGFCNNSGPAFIMGAVGAGVFSSAAAGLLLYAAHALAAVICGLLLRGGAGEKPGSAPSPTPPLPFSAALPEAVSQGLAAILKVCGFVVCFTVFTGLLEALGLFSRLSLLINGATGAEIHWARALLTGFFELGSAVGVMKGLAPSPGNLALAAGLLGWGGISVHFQTLSLIADTDIKSAPHFAGRLISAAVGALLAYTGALLFF